MKEIATVRFKFPEKNAFLIWSLQPIIFNLKSQDVIFFFLFVWDILSVLTIFLSIFSVKCQTGSIQFHRRKLYFKCQYCSSWILKTKLQQNINAENKEENTIVHKLVIKNSCRYRIWKLLLWLILYCKPLR